VISRRNNRGRQAALAQQATPAQQAAPARQAAIVGLLLVGITLAGVMAYANPFSFLMLVCLGTPGLILVLDSLFSA
jgi:hypothetical protein